MDSATAPAPRGPRAPVPAAAAVAHDSPITGDRDRVAAAPTVAEQPRAVHVGGAPLETLAAAAAAADEEPDADGAAAAAAADGAPAAKRAKKANQVEMGQRCSFGAECYKQCSQAAHFASSLAAKPRAPQPPGRDSLPKLGVSTHLPRDTVSRDLRREKFR